MSNFAISQNLLNNGDFEQGINIGFSYTSSNPGYTFISAPSPPTSDGQLAIGINPQPYNPSSFIITFDHTFNNGSGKMLIVDGRNNNGNPEPFFWRVNNNGEICGLQTGVKYIFSYWIRSIYNASISGASEAKIGIKWNNVQGQDGQGFLNPTGGILAPGPGAGWKQEKYEFTPTNSCVRIEMFTWNGSLAGNDFAIDDLELKLAPEPLLISASLTNITCPGENDGIIIAYGKGGKLPYKEYVLTGPTSRPPNTTGIFSGLAPGTYTVRVKDQDDVTETTSIIQISEPSVTVSADKTSVCSGDQVTLTVNAPGGSSFSWTANTPDPTLTTPSIANPVVKPTATTTYKVVSELIASQELIYNGKFDLGNTGFLTDYNYYPPHTGGTGGSGGAQKAYSIVSTSKQLFPGFPTDCNNNNASGRGGNMMAFDGSKVANDKVWCQKVPVKAGQSYTFSYFIQSLVKRDLSSLLPNPILSANLEVQINGVPLAAGINANPQLTPINDCVWEPRTYTWNAGAGITLAEICIYNRELTPDGNDFALDDISFKPQVPVTCTKQITITVSNTPAKPETEYTSPTCTAAGVTKIKASSYNALYEYTITPVGSTTGSTVTIGTDRVIPGMVLGTEYTVTAKIGTCKSVASDKFKNEPKKTTPPNITNTISCSGTTGIVNITAPLNPGVGPAQYEYSLGGTTFGSGTTFSPLSNGPYTLVVKDINSGCTTSKNITVSCGCATSPAITLPSPASQSVCSEVPYTVSGLTFSNAGSGGVEVSSDGGGLLKLNGSGSGAATVTANTSPFNVTYTPDASDDGKVITITFKAEQPAGCVTTKEFELTVKPIPPKPATSSPKYYCEGSTTVTPLSATFLSGVQQNWYGTNATGTPSTTPSTPDVATSVGSPFTYYVSQTLNGCESDQSEIEVVVTPEIKPVFQSCVTTASSITFDWDDVPNAASYDITYEVNNSGSPQSGGNVTASTFTTPTPLDPEDEVKIVVTPKPDPSLPAGSTCFASDEKICQADACTVVTLTGTQDVCIDGSVSFTATPSGVGTWSSGNVGIAEIDVNGLITPKGKGTATMTYTLTSPVVGCKPAFDRDITVHPLPLVNAGADRSLELGSSVVLNGSTDAVSPTIVWSPSVGLSSTTVLKPSAKPQETTEYTLEITSQKGCVSSDKVNVVVIRPVQVPNIFSPNGDGVHDRWVIGNIEDYPDAEVEIFNRYGTQVYEVKGYDNANAWEGKLNGVDLPVGAYYYIIRLNGKLKPIAGVISIIR